MFHTRLLGQAPIARNAATTWSALAVGTRGPEVTHRAKIVESRSYRWMYLAGSSLSVCSRRIATLCGTPGKQIISPALQQGVYLNSFRYLRGVLDRAFCPTLVNPGQGTNLRLARRAPRGVQGTTRKLR
jgi:hypothetical protein